MLQFDDGSKRSETHVNLEVQRHNHLRFCEWQEKLRITRGGELAGRDAHGGEGQGRRAATR